MTTETAHRLTNYVGKCAHIHGHSYKWQVEAALDTGLVQRNGISIDFGNLKEAMNRIIYHNFDHALVLHEDDPLCCVQELGRAADGNPQKVLRFESNPTAENFARWVFAALQTLLQEEYSELYYVLAVRVWETENSSGVYSRPMFWWRQNQDDDGLAG